jgi:hypothetical protein
MLASASNQKVAPSPDNTPAADAKPNTERSGTSSSAQVTVGINFTSQTNLCGPVFGPPPRPLPIGVRPNPGPPPRPLPIGVRPNPGPPPRPTPTLPNPFPNKSNEQLAWGLLNNYEAFKGRWSSTVTPQSIAKMANRPLTGNAYTDANIQLANELQRRPDLMQALDRNGSTGALDGRLSRDDIRSFIGSANPLKLSDDKQLVRDMLTHFNALKGGYFSNSIKLNDISARASRPLTGNPYQDHLIQLSREVMSRSDLQAAMDNRSSWLRDGRITQLELFELLR